MNSTESFKFNLILGVCGCAQAEYTPGIVQTILNDFKKVNLQLIVIATPTSEKFFDVARVQKMLPERFFMNHFDHSAEFHVPHVQLAEWADLICVYPTSANSLAKIAHGLTDTLLVNTILATRAPVYLGPTMNDAMYDAKVVKQNFQKIKALGYKLIPREKANVFIHSQQKEVVKDFVSERMLMKVIISELKKKAKK